MGFFLRTADPTDWLENNSTEILEDELELTLDALPVVLIACPVSRTRTIRMEAGIGYIKEELGQLLEITGDKRFFLVQRDDLLPWFNPATKASRYQVVETGKFERTLQDDIRGVSGSP